MWKFPKMYSLLPYTRPYLHTKFMKLYSRFSNWSHVKQRAKVNEKYIEIGTFEDFCIFFFFFIKCDPDLSQNLIMSSFGHAPAT